MMMDAQLGLDLRDQGMVRTLAAEREEWLENAIVALRSFASHCPKGFTIEEFRAAFRHEPHSHKVWGALTTVAAKRGVIVATGQYRKAKSPGTHAHPVMVWRRP